MNDENEALMLALEAQREHILGALDGLSEDGLRRGVLPSGWTALGLVRHLAMDVERLWFRAAVAGEQVELCHGAEAWAIPDGMPGTAVIDLYRAEIAAADAIIAATPLDAMPKWWPDLDAFPARPLRRVILHVITETATHAGHLDAARELIDGEQWLVNTG